MSVWSIFQPSLSHILCFYSTLALSAFCMGDIPTSWIRGPKKLPGDDEHLSSTCLRRSMMELLKNMKLHGCCEECLETLGTIDGYGSAVCFEMAVEKKRPGVSHNQGGCVKSGTWRWCLRFLIIESFRVRVLLPKHIFQHFSAFFSRS